MENSVFSFRNKSYDEESLLGSSFLTTPKEHRRDRTSYVSDNTSITKKFQMVDSNNPIVVAQFFTFGQKNKRKKKMDNCVILEHDR
eukprot:UN11527